MKSRPLIDQLTILAAERGEDLKLLFSLTRSLPLAQLSKKAFTDLEEKADVGPLSRHRGPPTQDSLKNLAASGGLGLTWRDLKKEVLTECESRGLVGLPELMYSVITNLAPEGPSGVSGPQ